MNPFSERVTKLVKYKEALKIVIQHPMSDELKATLCYMKEGVVMEIDDITEHCTKEGIVL